MEEGVGPAAGGAADAADAANAEDAVDAAGGGAAEAAGGRARGPGALGAGGLGPQLPGLFSRGQPRLTRPYRALSRLVGRLDVVIWHFNRLHYRVWLMGGAPPLFFSRGWGDIERVMREADAIDARVSERGVPAAEHDPLHLDLRAADPGLVGSSGQGCPEGYFLSPAADLLPPESKVGRCLLCGPRWDCLGGGSWEERLARAPAPAGVVILLGATGEVDYCHRAQQAAELARHGLYCILLMSPHYGPRKPQKQRDYFIDTVADYHFHTIAGMFEAAALAQWALARWPAAHLCISGFSFGGVLAAGASMFVGNSLQRPVACVPYVGCESPEVLKTGLMNGYVDYSGQFTDDLKTREDVDRRMLEIHAKFNHARLMRTFLAQRGVGEEAPLIASTHVIGTRDDHFIHPMHSRALSDVLEPLTAEGRASHEWQPGGHVVAQAYRLLGRGQVPGILKAMSRL